MVKLSFYVKKKKKKKISTLQPSGFDYMISETGDIYPLLNAFANSI